MNKLSVFIILLLAMGMARAVAVSENGYGQAIILPYYTVNNELNSLITINNSTDQVKAIKVNFREGKEGLAVLSFNLYLAPYDMWAAGLVSTTSSIQNHQGEDSVAVVFSDTSCSPFLQLGQEFLPFEIEAESNDTDMSRSREGYIEVIEMGELDPDSGMGLNTTFNSNGENNCAAVQAAHNSNGIWGSETGDLTEQLMPVKGGLIANLGIIDVAEGSMYTIDGVAFEYFYPPNTIIHTSPGDTQSPSLADADTTSVLISQGELVQTEWDHGYQAISALLTKKQILSEYMLDPVVAGNAELVFSFPTKRFHYDQTGNALLPFTKRYDQLEGACEEIDIKSWDRESGDNYCLLQPGDPLNCNAGGGAGTLPGFDPYIYKLCFATTTVEPSTDYPSINHSGILGSRNYFPVISSTEGKILVEFNQAVDSPGNQSAGGTHRFRGLPVLVNTFQKMINASAAPGLMAIYGGNYKASYTTRVD